jgi:hypothetical protein
LFFQSKQWIWSIFNGPETMPTGTGNDRSGISQSATEDDSLISPQAKCWLGETIWSEESHSLFLEDVRNKCAVLRLLWRSTPDVKAVSRH